MKLPKTRIVEKIRQNGEKYYLAQYRIFFIFFEWRNIGWLSEQTYDTLEEAKEAIDRFLIRVTHDRSIEKGRKIVQTNYIKYP